MPTLTSIEMDFGSDYSTRWATEFFFSDISLKQSRKVFLHSKIVPGGGVVRISTTVFAMEAHRLLWGLPISRSISGLTHTSSVLDTVRWFRCTFINIHYLALTSWALYCPFSIPWPRHRFYGIAWVSYNLNISNYIYSFSPDKSLRRPILIKRITVNYL